MKTAITALAIVAGTAANAQTLTAVAENPANNNFASVNWSQLTPAYDGDAMLTVWSPGDMFGITNRATAGGAGLPFAIADDSLSIFTGDTQGIIGENDNGDFFGIVDSQNSTNPSNGGVAEFTWTNPGANLFVDSFSVDVAAMGDFEASNDLYQFEISADGGSTFNTVAAAVVREDLGQGYTMDGGAFVTLDDPIEFGGALLTNDFATVSFTGLNLAVTGDIVLRFAGQSDGGSEAFAWRNGSIEVIPAPASAALLGLGGLAAARRRR